MNPGTSPMPVPTTAERKAALVLRMQGQRESWRRRRDAPDNGGEADEAGTFPRSRVFRFVLANPALAAAAVGLVVAAGPARLVRWGSWLLPLLMRR